MKIWALTNWFDEDPEVLYEMVESCALVCDGVVALDGRYPLYPDERDRSPQDQHDAIVAACADNNLAAVVRWTPPIPEVEKRTLLFDLALSVAEPMVDWYLIMDADHFVYRCDEPAVVHAELAATERHVATVNIRDVPRYAAQRPQNPPVPFTFLMRALPGLRVWGRHSYYVAELDGHLIFPWNAPHGFLPENPHHLAEHVLLHHYPYDREASRDSKRHGYYCERATSNIEFDPGPWAEKDPPWLEALHERHGDVGEAAHHPERIGWHGQHWTWRGGE